MPSCSGNGTEMTFRQFFSCNRSKSKSPAEANGFHLVNGGDRPEEEMRLVYVGEGKGSYMPNEPAPVMLSRKMEEKHPPCTAAACVLGSMLCLVFTGTFALLTSLLSGEKEDPSTAVSGGLHNRDSSGGGSSSSSSSSSSGSGHDRDGASDLKGLSVHVTVTDAPTGADATSTLPGFVRHGSSLYDCSHEEDASKWPTDQRVWCCDNEGMGCPEMDCVAGFSEWQQTWPIGKQRWCCIHRGLACDGDAAAGRRLGFLSLDAEAGA